MYTSRSCCFKLPITERMCLNLNISCRYVEGGMGSVSLAISNAAKEAGAHIVTSAEVYVSGITPVAFSNACLSYKYF